MKLTKLGHACVRLEKAGRTIVIDPGTFSGEGLLDGAEAVLITHEHFDHVDKALLAKADPGLEIWTCQGVADHLGEIPPTVHVVRDGDAFDAAGFRVRVAGEWHAVNLPDVAPPQNIGFLVDEEVFYPGDAFTPPPVEVPTVLVPTNAPWLRGADWIQYLRQVRPARAYSTHDGLLNEIGLGLVDAWLQGEADKQRADFRRLKPGESVELP